MVAAVVVLVIAVHGRVRLLYAKDDADDIRDTIVVLQSTFVDTDAEVVHRAASDTALPRTPRNERFASPAAAAPTGVPTPAIRVAQLPPQRLCGRTRPLQ